MKPLQAILTAVAVVVVALLVAFVFASCDSLDPVETEIVVVDDAIAKVCSPDKPPRTQGACEAAENGTWVCDLNLNGTPEDPTDDFYENCRCNCDEVIGKYLFRRGTTYIRRVIP